MGYGINGMKNVKNKLEKNGYILYDIKDNDGNDILAVK